MQSPAVADDFAEGKVELITHYVSTETLVLIASRKNERETRSERRGVFVFHECLKPVVKPYVFNAFVVFCEDVRNRVRELVSLTENRPFLSKTWGDFTRAIGEIYWQIEYVLHHPRLLIVGFFYEERVILDAFGQRLGAK